MLNKHTSLFLFVFYELIVLGSSENIINKINNESDPSFSMMSVRSRMKKCLTTGLLCSFSFVSASIFACLFHTNTNGSTVHEKEGKSPGKKNAVCLHMHVLEQPTP